MTTTVANRLLKKLEERRVKEGLSQRRFAMERLEISPELWRKTRNGERKIGPTVQKAIIKAYPELRQDVLFLLDDDAGIPSNSGDPPAASHQPHQFNNLSGFRVIPYRFYLWLKRQYRHIKAKLASR